MTGLQARIVLQRGDGFSLDIALAIPAGRTLALVGPNGAGKSTVAAALAGLLSLDSGEITLSGTLLDGPATGAFVPPQDRRLGLVFQDNVLFPHLTVLENVAFGLRSRGVPTAHARSQAAAWLERVGLAGLDDRRPGELSGGQAQRVALARALVTDPAMLLLDEPMAALDVRTRGEVRAFLSQHLASFSGPRLLITHDPSEALEMADEICVLEGGRITQTGSPDEIRMRPRTAYVAEFAGSNLFTGHATESGVSIGEITLATAHPEMRGAVRVSIRPNAISVHCSEPGGSPRNRWQTRVVRVQDNGGSVRIQTDGPLPLMLDVTPAARAELALEPGAEVWVSVKATEIGVESVDG